MVELEDWDPTAHTDARPPREQRVIVGSIDPGREPYPTDASDS